jgi:hypothetical protein
MTRMMLVAVLAAPLASGCAPQTKNAAPAPGGQMPQAIIAPYLEIQKALARDSVDGVKGHAGEIATAASGLGAPAVKIDMAAVQLAAATELPDARDRFGKLSEAVVDYMNGLHLTPPSGVREAFCPMALEPWLQEGTTLANPYYGSAMPTCGAFR